MPRRPDAPTTQRPILAIDPGRSKCGLAVVASNGTILHRAIVPTGDLAGLLPDLCRQFEPQAIVLGDGTGSRAVRTALECLALGCPVATVDEKRTSEQARARYLKEIPARGLLRLPFLRFLRTPETPYDDYVAVILAERWWVSATAAEMVSCNHAESQD